MSSFGVENTDIWLKDSLNDPIEICRKICQSRDDNEPKKLYHYLLQFGMYRPSSKSKTIYEELLESQTWEKVTKYFYLYKEKWNGPNIPIYIFPLDHKNSLFMKQNIRKKSGVSFLNQIFLFLTNLEDDKEIEALLVHEYHHVCRMTGLNYPVEEYTLLDSIIMEGLAEDAVHEYVGKKYVAEWSYPLPKDTFERYWKIYLKDQLSLKKSEKLHDQLLFGKGLFPNMLGYTIGYNIIRKFREAKDLTIEDSFIMLAKYFL